ncbi:hypothetical protein GCM10023323_54010 [Streptomyces thinghirensis]|uniref:Uncharacterized protein n=1 Tax=Streptomyces thinghirensis TaxID=551547 RepID=A0ABP9T8E2_9ACTN
MTRLTARVVVGADRFEDRPRTHTALLVEIPGDPRPYLAEARRVLVADFGIDVPEGLTPLE